MSKLQQNLWQLYQSTVFEWQSSSPDFDDFAIITAHNPRGNVCCAEENMLLHQQFLQELLLGDLRFAPIVGCAPDNSHRELSLAVACDLPYALELARRWQQNAIYWVAQNQLYLYSVLISMPRA
ncbi:DUF3293 domain-containing protein [Motilimonas pumila]|uniref:DUF3293 domain-containing protein n=1 Tax=Motilimonas pumila TaxID=2303987 RepID=UPI001314E0B2|nr:DUF3293 domain-containing protein [Motilimonas pumila]